MRKKWISALDLRIIIILTASIILNNEKQINQIKKIVIRI